MFFRALEIGKIMDWVPVMMPFKGRTSQENQQYQRPSPFSTSHPGLQQVHIVAFPGDPESLPVLLLSSNAAV